MLESGFWRSRVVLSGILSLVSCAAMEVYRSNVLAESKRGDCDNLCLVSCYYEGYFLAFKDYFHLIFSLCIC